MLGDMESLHQHQMSQARQLLVSLVKQQALRIAMDARKKIDKDSRRLARLVIERAGIEFVERQKMLKCFVMFATRDLTYHWAYRWQEGYAFQKSNTRLTAVQNQKDALDRERKLLTRKKSSTTEPLTPAQSLELEEIHKLKLQALKREEQDLQKESESLRLQRDMHVREVNRIRHEDQSLFNSRPVLTERYQLLSLLGNGGFSEVWKAFDLVELREVACK